MYVPMEWVCDPLMRDIDGNTPAMISVLNGLSP